MDFLLAFSPVLSFFLFIGLILFIIGIIRGGHFNSASTFIKDVIEKTIKYVEGFIDFFVKLIPFIAFPYFMLDLIKVAFISQIISKEDLGNINLFSRLATLTAVSLMVFATLKLFIFLIKNNTLFKSWQFNISLILFFMFFSINTFAMAMSIKAATKSISDVFLSDSIPKNEIDKKYYLCINYQNLSGGINNRFTHYMLNHHVLDNDLQILISEISKDLHTENKEQWKCEQYKNKSQPTQVGLGRQPASSFQAA